MAKLQESGLVDQLPRKLRSVVESFLDAAEFFAVSVGQSAAGESIHVNSLNRNFPGLKLPNLHVETDSLVLAIPHVVLDALHDRFSGGDATDAGRTSRADQVGVIHG